MKKTKNDLKSFPDLSSFKTYTKHQINRVLSDDLFWLFLVCFSLRLLFYSNYSNTDGWFPDTKSYLNHNSNILLGQIDVLRTPGYPYLIDFIRLFGTEHLLYNIKLAQCIISFLTIIIFYRILTFILKNRRVVFFTTIVFSITPSISNLDVCVLTESLSLNAVVIFLYLIISYLKEPKYYKTAIIALYVFFLIMLRPSFIYLIILMLIFWILRALLYKSEWKLNLLGITTSIVSIFLIGGYSQLNYINNDFNGITAVSVRNQIQNIITYNIYENGNDPEITEAIKNGSDFTYSYTRMSEFVQNCILNNPSIYIRKTLMKIIDLSQATTVIMLAKFKNGLLGIPNLISNLFSISFLNLYFIILLDFVYIIVRWIKTKQISWLKLVLWLFIAGQFATIIFGSFTEYQRLFVPVLPCIIIILFSYIDMVFSSIDPSKLSKYTKSTFEIN